MRAVSNHPPRPGRLVLPAGLAVVLFAAAGCASRYTPVPVSGVVTLDGHPIGKATVSFHSVGDEKEGRPAQGVTDENGEFCLSTLGDKDGALPGDYKVVVHKFVETLPNLKIPDFPNTPEGKIQRSDFMYRNFEAKGILQYKNALPPKYGDPSTTPLSCKVTGKMTVKFELTSN